MVTPTITIIRALTNLSPDTFFHDEEVKNSLRSRELSFKSDRIPT